MYRYARHSTLKFARAVAAIALGVCAAPAAFAQDMDSYVFSPNKAPVGKHVWCVVCHMVAAHVFVTVRSESTQRSDKM